VPLEQRLANAPKLAAGMTIKAFTDLIGCPDAKVFDGEWAYDYGIDSPTPYTLRVFLNRDFAAIRAVKTITPFAFRHDPARQRAY